MENKKISAWSIIAGFFGIVGIVLAWNALPVYIENIVEKKVSDPIIIDKIKSQVRPIVIFDRNESILADSGGMQYIDDIEIIEDENDENRIEIIITPKVYLAIEPLLESLDSEFSINVKRGEKFQLIYELKRVKRLLLASSSKHKNNRFRLEIII